MPVGYLGSDTGNTWKGNGEMKRGREFTKKALLSKRIMTVGNKFHSAGGTLRACEMHAPQRFPPKGQGIWGV